MPAVSGRRPVPDAVLRYRAALRLSGAVAYYLASLPVRLGAAMLSLGVLVLVHSATGSYAAAGALAGPPPWLVRSAGRSPPASPTGTVRAGSCRRWPSRTRWGWWCCSSW
ncbi:hypothetical protein [Actinocatenispora rupis]|uniref:hypothetical protein n=1 Tax=Actinocatenispora rupis TaxID=519421 RepID=UPI0019416CFC|nr:hypothetical protein [Actinocatenispora rupis]